MTEDAAPGWDAIERAVLKHLHPEGEPRHWSTSALPGQDGVDGISAYRLTGRWFFVTFGLTELYAKESENPGTSGWGFELTMRTPRSEGDDDPPTWPVTLLRGLGQYVYSHSAPFAAGHRIDPGGPITGAGNTRLTAVAFTADPQVPEITTPHGSVRFLQAVGITDAELERMQQSSTAAVLDELREHSWDLATDAGR